MCVARGWKSKAEQARGLGVSRMTIHRWYGGATVGPTHADHVAEVLNVRFEALFISQGVNLSV